MPFSDLNVNCECHTFIYTSSMEWYNVKCTTFLSIIHAFWLFVSLCKSDFTQTLTECFISLSDIKMSETHSTWILVLYTTHNIIKMSTRWLEKSTKCYWYDVSVRLVDVVTTTINCYLYIDPNEKSRSTLLSNLG